MYFHAFNQRGRNKSHNEDALLWAGLVRQGSVDTSGFVDATHPVVFAVADGVSTSYQPRRASRTLLGMLAVRWTRDPMQNLGHMLWALHTDYKLMLRSGLSPPPSRLWGKAGMGAAVPAVLAGPQPMRKAPIPAFPQWGKEHCTALRNISYKALGKSHASFGMASTLVEVRIAGLSVTVFNVGDSPAIVLDAAGGWTQLSHDHTQLQELVDEGEIESDQARDVGSIYGGLTSQFISEPDTDDFQVHLSNHTLQQGETLLLASDGLTQALCHHDIANLLLGHKTLALAELFHAARARGGEDDFSVIAIRLD